MSLLFLAYKTFLIIIVQYISKFLRNTHWKNDFAI